MAGEALQALHRSPDVAHRGLHRLRSALRRDVHVFHRREQRLKLCFCRRHLRRRNPPRLLALLLVFPLPLLALLLRPS